jgi:hypothetical protein
VRPFSDGKWGRRRGDSIVLEADETAKSGVATGEAKSGGWRSKMMKGN